MPTRAIAALAVGALLLSALAGPAASARAAHARAAKAASWTIADNPGLPVATGRPVYLTLTAASPASGPPVVGRVTWRVLDAGNADARVVGDTASATFTARAPGTYAVEATSGGASVMGSVVIHGPPAAVVLTPSPVALPRDGGYASFTATVVDAHGVRLGDFVGNVRITDTNGQMCSHGGGNSDLLHLADGVATDQVCAATPSQADTDTLTASDLTQGFIIASPVPVAGVRYGTLTVNNVAPVVKTLSYQIQQGDPPYLSANQKTSMQIMVTTRDQDGNLIGDPPAAVSISLTGPGSLSESSVLKTETLATPTAGDVLTVFSQPGQGGPITVTASAPGWTGWAYTIQSYLNTEPAGLVLTPDGTGVDRSGMPYSIYMLTLVDTKGQPEALASDEVSLTDNAARQPTANPIADYYGGPHASILYAQQLPGSIPGMGQIGVPGGAPQPIYIADGQALIDVETAAAGDQPVTLTVTDQRYHFTATATYNWQIGPIEGSWPAPNQFFASPMTSDAAQPSCQVEASGQQDACNYDVLTGQTLTYGVQLTDPNGNPIAQADVPVYFGTGGSDPAKMPNGQQYDIGWTGPTGVASMALAAPKLLLPRTGQNATPSEFSLESWLQDGSIGIPQYVVQSGFGPQVDVVTAADYATSVRLTGLPKGSLRVGGTATVHVSVNNAQGQAITETVAGTTDFNDDVLSIRSSRPGVLALVSPTTGLNTGFAYIPPAVGSDGALSWALPRLDALRPGEATITVRDVSNASRPTATLTVVVSRG